MLLNGFSFKCVLSGSVWHVAWPSCWGPTDASHFLGLTSTPAGTDIDSYSSRSQSLSPLFNIHQPPVLPYLVFSATPPPTPARHNRATRQVMAPHTDSPVSKDVSRAISLPRSAVLALILDVSFADVLIATSSYPRKTKLRVLL